VGQTIDYDLICRAARKYSSKLPSSVDWRDLAQQAALHGLMGRASIDGPMQDFLRKIPMVGGTRTKVMAHLVDLDDVGSTLAANDARPDVVVIIDEAVKQLIYDPVLTARERRLLRAMLKDNASLEKLARRRRITPGRVGQLLMGIREKLREDRRTNLHDLYINRGLSCKKIADLFGTSPQAIWLSLKEFGIKRRPPKMIPATKCVECDKPIHYRRRYRFHYGQMIHRYSVRSWAKRVAERGPVTPEYRSQWAKRVWENRRKRFGLNGGNPIGPRARSKPNETQA